MLAGAAVGLPIGLLVFLRADDRVLGIVIGVAVLVAVVVIARGLDLRHAGPGLDVGGGVLSGALTMSAGVNGPPLVFVLQARHFDQHRFRARSRRSSPCSTSSASSSSRRPGRSIGDVLVADRRRPARRWPSGRVAGIALRRHLDARALPPARPRPAHRRRHLGDRAALVRSARWAVCRRSDPARRQSSAAEHRQPLLLGRRAVDVVLLADRRPSMALDGSE